jgi:hypothetical protein
LNRFAGRLGLGAFATILVALARMMVGVISRDVFDLVFAIASTATVPAFLIKIGTNPRLSFGVAFALLMSILVMWATIAEIRFAPYLAVVLINAAVAYVFLRGQLPGHTPLILQLVALIGIAPIGPKNFQRFIYWQCWAWVGFGTVTSLIGVIAMTVHAFRPLAGLMIAGLMIAQLIWFIVSHGYANWRHKRPETWRDTVRAMTRPTIWQELNI